MIVSVSGRIVDATDATHDYGAPTPIEDPGLVSASAESILEESSALTPSQEQAAQDLDDALGAARACANCGGSGWLRWSDAGLMVASSRCACGGAH